MECPHRNAVLAMLRRMNDRLNHAELDHVTYVGTCKAMQICYKRLQELAR